MTDVQQVALSILNLELFRDSYTMLLNQGDGSSAPENIGARVGAAIEQARNKLTVFQ